MRISSTEQLNKSEFKNIQNVTTGVPYFGLSKMNSGKLDADVFDDGKISTKSKVQHFVKGIISPITSLLSSPKNLAIGLGMIALGGAVCAAVPTIMPLFIAGGVIGGALQIGKGAYKAATAKTDSEAQKAWENLGAGTFAVGSSVVGAKKSLKTAGYKDVDNMNFAKATLKCFKESKNSVSKSVQMVKNKTAFTNLKSTFIKPENISQKSDLERLEKLGYGQDKLDEIIEYSKALEKEGKAAIDATLKDNSIDELKSVMPKEVADTMTYRVKSVSSIKDKLIKRLESERKIDSIDDARAAVGDLIGTRVTVEQVGEAQMNELVDSLAEGLRNGKIQFTDIDNYHGQNATGSEIAPYFTEDHLDTLREAANVAKRDFAQFEGSGSWSPANAKVRSSGYTTAQINVKYSNGSFGEFQIRGKEVQKLAEVEHIPYDLRTSKDITKGKVLLKTLFKPLKSKIDMLTEDGYAKYNEYLTSLYDYHRNVEKGINVGELPKIKDYFDVQEVGKFFNVKDMSSLQNKTSWYDNMLKTLDIGNINNLHNDASWLEKIPQTEIIDALRGGLTAYVDEKSIKNN